MDDYISKLKRFSKLDLQSKQAIIMKGRPMPKLKNLIQTEPTNRFFQPEWYTRKEWLCGCPKRNRLFCFPCLLFAQSNSVWTREGYCDLKNFTRGLGKHERSTAHIQSQINLKTFGLARIDVAQDEERRLEISIHNAKVKANREILKELINATCFLAKQQLAFGSANRGNYVELLHVFAEKDEKLAKYLETSSVFSDLFNGIQSDLIEAIGDVIRTDIKKDIRAAPFVVVEVDETSYITNKSQISVILRYVAKAEAGYEVKEAFLDFDDMSADARAPAIADYVLGVLKKYGCVNKLVAQTYDGAAVMSSELYEVQTKIKEKVPQAMFTHSYYAHKLNPVLSHSANCIPECCTFFKTAEGLGTFFNNSTKRTHFLDNIVKRRLPKAESTNWSSSLLQTISRHQKDLLTLFHIILENPESWDTDTVMMAAGYNMWLSKRSTCFLLTAYEGLFSETNTLFKVLQNKDMDTEHYLSVIRNTDAALERMRLEFDSFYDQFELKWDSLGLTESEDKQSAKDERRHVFCNILDNVSNHVKAMLDYFDGLAFLGLVDFSKFKVMSQQFDDKKLQNLSKYKFFDLARLKADLIGLYSSQTVRDECKSPGQLLNFLAQNDLIQTVPEATAFLQLVLTLSATTASVERLSALRKLKTYCQSRTDQGQLSSLALISIETERLVKLKANREDFYKNVTDVFVKKDQHVDFIYK